MRPTIALACILKNELHNLPFLLESVKDCFDEIHLTDTGSNDGSIEWILKHQEAKKNPSNTDLTLHHFEWVYDFAKARNYSFSHVKSDYIAWLDLDDKLSDPKAFIDWRDEVMSLGDYWMATYHYASNSEGKPVCSFARERVVRRDIQMPWRYFIHEGLAPDLSTKKNLAVYYASTWNVIHRRSEEDLKQDRSRNIGIFEKHLNDLDPRMHYYYGKELFEAGKPLEAFSQLMTAVSDMNLEMHDRIMGLQYCCIATMQLGQFERSIQLAHQGLQLAPQRAEFWVVLGDCYLKRNQLQEAAAFYLMASQCKYVGDGKHHHVIFSHEDSYKHYPLNQLARIYANMGDVDKALEYANKALNYGPNFESVGIVNDLTKLKDKSNIAIHSNKQKTKDIVISCHPTGFYEWDEDVYREKGIGGSETAVVEMSRELARLTGRNVHVFNNRNDTKEYGKVKYFPAANLPGYLAQYKPGVHIAWRHNIKLTNAPTYLWCHDLSVPGLEAPNYDHVMALSDFHKKFLTNLVGVPKDKIIVTRNGIDPKRFFFEPPPKVPAKVIWSSSPDRGLKRALKVMDQVVKIIPDAELYSFYGFDNMLKMGKDKEVKELQQMIDKRPWAMHLGNVSKEELTKHMQSSEVWLYPTNFLETYCITAIEAVCSKTFPVVRAWGALNDTLKGPKERLWASVLDSDCDTEADEAFYARSVREAITGELWKGIQTDPNEYGWDKVATEWIEFMGL